MLIDLKVTSKPTKKCSGFSGIYEITHSREIYQSFLLVLWKVSELPQRDVAGTSQCAALLETLLTTQKSSELQVVAVLKITRQGKKKNTFDSSGIQTLELSSF